MHDELTSDSRVTAEPMTERAAAGRLGLTAATLRAWRHQGRGPAFVRLGRAVRYLPDDVNEYLRANRQQPSTVNVRETPSIVEARS
jgi:predicted site-specific integrase-resolvase